MAEIKLIIEMDGQQKVVTVLGQVDDAVKRTGDETERTSKKVRGFATDLNQTFELIAKAVRKIRQAIEFAEKGAKFQQQTQALDALAGKYNTTADAIVKQIQRVSDGTASMEKAVVLASRGISLGLKPDEVIAFTEIARAAAKATGRDFEFLFDSILTGTVRQSKLLLDNANIILTVGEANRRYAAAMGKTVDKLTDMEKRQAFTNEAIRQGQVIVKDMADVVSTNADSFAIMNTVAANLQIILASMFADFVGGTGVVNNLSSGIQKLTDFLSENRDIIIDATTAGVKFAKELSVIISFVEPLFRLLGKLLSIFAKIVGILKSVIGFFKTLGAIISGVVSDALAVLRKRFSGVIGTATTVSQKIQTVIDKVKELAALALTPITFVIEVITRITGPAKGFVASAAQGFAAAAEAEAARVVGPAVPTGGGGAQQDPFPALLESIMEFTNALGPARDKVFQLRSALIDMQGASDNLKLTTEQMRDFDEAAEEAFEAITRFGVTQTLFEQKQLVESITKAEKTRVEILTEQADALDESLSKVSLLLLAIETLGFTGDQVDSFRDFGDELQRALEITEQQIEAEKELFNERVELITIEAARDAARIAQLEKELHIKQLIREFELRGPVAERDIKEQESEIENLIFNEETRLAILDSGMIAEVERRIQHRQEIEAITKSMWDGIKSSYVAGIEASGAALVQGGSSLKNAAINSAAEIVAGVARVWGTFYLLEGTAKIAASIFPPNPVGLASGIKEAAGGAALLALAGAAKGFAAQQTAGGGGAAGGGAGAGAAPGGGAGPGGFAGPPVPEQQQPGRAFIINVRVENMVGAGGMQELIEDHIIPGVAEGIGRGNIGSAEINLTAQRE